MIVTNKNEAQSEIGRLVNVAYEALQKAEALADEYQLSFDFDLTYGAGATYYPPSMLDDEERAWLGLEDGQGGWQASSQSC